MIVDALLSALASVVGFLTAPLPDADPLVSTGYFQVIASNLGAINYFLPIAEVFAVVLAVVFVFPILMGVSLTLWVLAQIRGSAA